MTRALLFVVALVVAFAPSAHADPFGSLAAPSFATELPAGFSESTVWSGLGNPTALRFAPDGRAYVTTKAGLVYVFDSVDDPIPTVFADLRDEVQDFWDRGLLGLAVDPADGTVYVAYSRDTGWGDTCPDSGTAPPGCTIDARVSRLAPDGTETVLLEDFCHQFPSHSIGTLDFGPDGMLYLSVGEGAHFDYADFGQIGNVCKDPPNPDGSVDLPDTQGGALRAQSFRRPAGQDVSLDGAILRLDPATGEAAPGNPATGARAPIVAYGFRNPFRFTFRPGTGELWTGDVGWTTWEEINRVPDITQVRNYGWPCYEGASPQPAYDALDVTTCETLYTEGSAMPPYFVYNHGDPVLADDGCAPGDSSVSALSFYSGAAFPAEYHGALFFGDYSRGCIWAMPLGSNGQPDPTKLERFAGGAPGPVFLTEGSGDALYYADLEGGTIRRIAYGAPTAAIEATPESGLPPLTVAFDGTGSSEPADGELTYAWDLDGDGAYDDSTAPTPEHTYTENGAVTVRLRVTGPTGLTGVASKRITVGVPPTVEITSPLPSTTWAVGERIDFSATAQDALGDPLTPVWQLQLRHCSRLDPNECHTHPLQELSGVAGYLIAPDHEYPSHLELTATATDANGLTASKTMRLDPRTTEVTLETSPPGLELAFGSESLAAPFTRTVLARSAISLNAPSPQQLDGVPYAWTTWSDALGRVHTTTVPDGGRITYMATFAGPPPTATPSPAPTATPSPTATPEPSPDAAPRPVAAWGFDEPSGRRVPGGTIAGALRVRGGRYGNALDFDGVDDWVTVKAPRLTTTLTVEAWVYPTRRGGTVALHETARGAAWSLYPESAAVGTRSAGGRAPKLRRWTHLALTYDGKTIRRYVDGVLVASRARSGALTRSAYPLRFGGNAVFKRWFRGRIDELRVYDRALTPAQIRRDMATPINATVTPARRAKRTKGGAKVKRYRG